MLDLIVYLVVVRGKRESLHTTLTSLRPSLSRARAYTSPRIAIARDRNAAFKHDRHFDHLKTFPRSTNYVTRAHFKVVIARKRYTRISQHDPRQPMLPRHVRNDLKSVIRDSTANIWDPIGQNIYVQHIGYELHWCSIRSCLYPRCRRQ